MLSYGVYDLGGAAGTVWVQPGFEELAAEFSYTFRATDFRTFHEMRVRHNTPSADPTMIQYRVRVNGVDIYGVDLAGSATDGANTTGVADIFPGDLVAIVAIKTGALVSGFLSVSIEIEDI